MAPVGLPAGLHLWGTFSPRAAGPATALANGELKPQPLGAPGRAPVADVALGFNVALVASSKGEVTALAASSRPLEGAAAAPGASPRVPASLPKVTRQGDVFRADRPLPHSAVAIAAGKHHGLALLAGGLVYSWGANSKAELGRDAPRHDTVPGAVALPGPANLVGAGHELSAAHVLGHGVYIWGAGHATPAPVAGIDGRGVRQLVLGREDIILVVLDDGGLVQVVREDDAWLARDVHVPDGFKVVQAAAGKQHVLLLSESGRVASFGNNAAGQVGVGKGDANVPSAVDLGLQRIAQVACGDFHSVARSRTGALYVWGQSKLGRIGLVTEENVYKPHLITSIKSRCTHVACGFLATAILTDGKDLSSEDIVSDKEARLDAKKAKKAAKKAEKAARKKAEEEAEEEAARAEAAAAEEEKKPKKKEKKKEKEKKEKKKQAEETETAADQGAQETEKAAAPAAPTGVPIDLVKITKRVKDQKFGTAIRSLLRAPEAERAKLHKFLEGFKQQTSVDMARNTDLSEEGIEDLLARLCDGSETEHYKQMFAKIMRFRKNEKGVKEMHAYTADVTKQLVKDFVRACKYIHENGWDKYDPGMDLSVHFDKGKKAKNKLKKAVEKRSREEDGVDAGKKSKKGKKTTQTRLQFEAADDEVSAIEPLPEDKELIALIEAAGPIALDDLYASFPGSLKEWHSLFDASHGDVRAYYEQPAELRRANVRRTTTVGDKAVRAFKTHAAVAELASKSSQLTRGAGDDPLAEVMATRTPRATRRTERITTPQPPGGGVKLTWDSEEDQDLTEEDNDNEQREVRGLRSVKVRKFNARLAETPAKRARTIPGSAGKKGRGGRRQRIAWSDKEVAALTDGVKKHGVGKWTAILENGSFHEVRTSVDLKDKWRNLVKQGLVK